jgi:hypothetical protein
MPVPDSPRTWTLEQAQAKAFRGWPNVIGPELESGESVDVVPVGQERAAVIAHPRRVMKGQHPDLHPDGSLEAFADWLERDG